jgi:hydroxymethylpyrimidine/phosphomethylpyrimidine kinase
MATSTTPPRVLIIAGSDSSGGAGIQADIKTVTMLGGYAMTAITAVTAQNTRGVTRIDSLPPESVTAQIDACLSDIGADAIKTAMIGAPDHVAAIAEALASTEAPLVVDPVLVATSGARLVTDDTLTALRTLLFPRAALLTPNLEELAVLAGKPIDNLEAAAKAARTLAAEYDCAVLAKGGHRAGDTLTDILIERDGTEHQFTAARIETRHTHGTGCTLASAIATELGRGFDLVEAVQTARAFVRAAIKAAPGFGAGSGPLGHHAARDLEE